MYFFSVIIPVYNVEDYLKECIESILKQNFKDIEIILIDDVSTDKSGEICDDFANQNKNVKVIHQEKNFGVAICRNVGINAAEGQYILFVDSDDYLLEGCLMGIARLIREKSEPDVMIGKFVNRPEKGGGFCCDHAYDSLIFNQGKVDAVLDHLKDMNGFLGVCWRYIIRREFIVDNNIYFVPAKIHEDQEFIVRLLCSAQSFALYNKIFYCYRTRSKSLGEAEDYDANSSCLEIIGEMCKFMKYNNLSDTKKDFIYARIKYACDLFIPRLLMHNREEIFGLSKIIEKYIDYIDILEEISNGFDMYFFIKTYGPFYGLILYKALIIEETISLVKDAKERDLYIFCAGIFGKSAAHILQKKNYPIKAFLDNNKALNNTSILGLKVNQPSVLKLISEEELANVFIVVCNQRPNVFQEISDQLKEIGLKEDQIVQKIF